MTTNYLYDGLDLTRETGPATADYLFGPGIDEPLAMRRSSQTYYYVVDGLGSVNLVTNASGVVQNKYLYDAWGQTRSQTGSLGNPFRYTAREAAEAGTLFYRARYLSPAIGRFLSEDQGPPDDLAVTPSLLSWIRRYSPLPLLRWNTSHSAVAPAPPVVGEFGGYTYVSNDPVKSADPTGNFELPWWVDVAHAAHVAFCAYENWECKERVDKRCDCPQNKHPSYREQVCQIDGYKCCDGNFWRCLVFRKPRPCWGL